MCHRWLLGFVVNSVGSSLVFFSYVGWICGLVIWCHFGEIRKDVQKHTGFGQLATALAALVPIADGRGGELSMECRAESLVGQFCQAVSRACRRLVRSLCGDPKWA